MYPILSRHATKLELEDPEFLQMSLRLNLKDRIFLFFKSHGLDCSRTRLPFPLNSDETMIFVNWDCIVENSRSLTLEIYLRDVQKNGLGLLSLIQTKMFTEESESRAREMLSNLQSRDVLYDSDYDGYLEPYIKHNNNLIPIDLVYSARHLKLKELRKSTNKIQGVFDLVYSPECPKRMNSTIILLPVPELQEIDYITKLFDLFSIHRAVVFCTNKSLDLYHRFVDDETISLEELMDKPFFQEIYDLEKEYIWSRICLDDTRITNYLNRLQKKSHNFFDISFRYDY